MSYFVEAGDLDLDDLIKENVCGQRRTSRHKKFSILTPKYFYKGPFRQDQLEVIEERVLKVLEWSLPHVFLPSKKVFRVSDDGVMIRYQNLEDYPFESEEHTESWSGGFTYRVLKRSRLQKFSDVPDLEWIYDFVPDLVVSLIGLSILRVGDLGTFNLLVDLKEKEVYITDYEETSTSIKTGSFFYFSRPPAKAVALKWQDQVDQYRNEIIKEVEKIPGSQEAIDQLTTTFKVEWKGISHSRIFSGYTLSEAKSALQKFIRRSKISEAVQVAYELSAFRDISQAVLSNLVNRLSVISAEDIGPANIPLVSDVLVTFQIENDYSLKKILLLTEQLARSPKARICSWLSKAHPNFERVDDAIDPPNFWKNGDPLEIQEIANHYYYFLKEKRREAFGAMNEYLEFAKGKKVKARRRRTKAEIILWEILRGITFETDRKTSNYLLMIDVLEKSFFECPSDNKAFIRLATFLAIEGMVKPMALLEEKSQFKAEEIQPLQFPSYVFDVHTLPVAERTEEKKQEFRRKGSKVFYQDPRFDDPQLFEIYTQ